MDRARATAVVGLVFLAAPQLAAAENVPAPPAVAAAAAFPGENGLIAFTSGQDGDQAIYLMGADGAAQTRIPTPSLTEAISPSWSPDVMNADGSGPTRLTTDETHQDWLPSWQPAPDLAPEPTVALTVTPGSAQQAVGEDHALRFTPMDATGTPVTGRDLLVRVTGSHPQTTTITSGSDGQATLTWVGSKPGTDTVIACADDDGNAVCGAEEPLVSATVRWVTVGEFDQVDEPRLAFTDDADALYAVDVGRDEDEVGDFFYFSGRTASYATDLIGYAAGPKHEGEAGGTPGSAPAFVSTRDDPNGDVYVATDTGATRVTCDPGIETHPVVNTDGAVAYASDADGDWDIYVSVPRDEPDPDPATCKDEWTTTNVTDAAPDTEDLWPTWTYTRENTPAGELSIITLTPTGLVFSRASDGELSDLYSVVAVGESWSTPGVLRETPDFAESQPAAMTFALDNCDDRCVQITSQTWVAFTTTEFRREGTIAFLSPEEPDEVVNDQRLNDVQASEPAWSSTVNPDHLAFTSTDNDPYGSVGIALFEAPTEESGGAGTSEPQVVDFGIVSGTYYSGIAESQPFWLRGFDSSDTNDDARLVYTSRSAEEEVDFGPRIRLLDADVSDALASDGSQRRVIRAQKWVVQGSLAYRYDEAGPSYSPDGGRIVYSRDANPSLDSGGGTRILVVADADGSNAADLLPDGQRQDSDLDLDPAWSPDGSKIAFVRIREAGDPREPYLPEIWVYDLITGVATRIPGTPEGADLSPSWAPDSEHLVIARTEDDGDLPFDTARRWGRNRVGSLPALFILDATDPTAPAVGFDSCSDLCGVEGRTPDWSPDGSRIVYEAGGQLRLITLPDPCCAGPVIDVESPVAVTGFDPSSGDPTPSRPVVSTAHDPAWSPDGSEIAFAGQPVGQPDQSGIWGIAPDGSGLRPVTDERGPETEPVYQPVRAADVGVTVSVAGTPALVGAPVLATFTVTNHGPTPAVEVALDTGFTAGASLTAAVTPPDCRADGSGCGFALLAVGESRAYQVQVQHLEAVTGAATGTVVADNPDPLGSNNTASAPYRFQAADLQVRVRIDENVGYVGGSRVAGVTVRNIGTDPVDDVLLTATWSDLVLPDVAPPLPPATPGCLPAGDGCALGTIAAGDKRSFLVVLSPLAEGIAPITAKVETSTAEVTTENNQDAADLEILQPTIRVLPSVAPPGRVVLVYGENMPPESEISLAWAPGINIHTGPFGVSEDGIVRVPLLIVRHDLLGTRLITATSTEDLFTPVEGVMLVVPRTLVPPNFNGRG